jgi:hypothetical protein
MDNIEELVSELPEISFGKEIAKTFIVSAAGAAGMMVGLLAVGFVSQKIRDRKLAKNKN